MPEIIQLARSTNNGMPDYAISVLQDLLNERGYPLKNTAVTVLGVAYKKNVDDARESPFFTVRDLLKKKGARLQVFDSWVSSENTAESLDEVIQGAKAIFIVTDHSDIVSQLQDMDLSQSTVEVIVDGRNCLEADTIEKQGILYRGIGRRKG